MPAVHEGDWYKDFGSIQNLVAAANWQKMSFSRPTFQLFQALMMQFCNASERADIFRICGDGFPDGFHLGIVPLESLIMVLLTDGEFPVALGHLLLKLPLAQRQFLEYALNSVKPLVAIRHVSRSPTLAYHRPRSIPLNSCQRFIMRIFPSIAFVRLNIRARNMFDKT